MPSVFRHIGLAVGRILAGFCSEIKTSQSLEGLKTWPLNDCKMQVKHEAAITIQEWRWSCSWKFNQTPLYEVSDHYSVLYLASDIRTCGAENQGENKTCAGKI